MTYPKSLVNLLVDQIKKVMKEGSLRELEVLLKNINAAIFQALAGNNIILLRDVTVYSRIDIVKFLLDKGADTNVQELGKGGAALFEVTRTEEKKRRLLLLSFYLTKELILIFKIIKGIHACIMLYITVILK